MFLDFRNASILLGVCFFLFSGGLFTLLPRQTRKDGMSEWIAGQFLIGLYLVFLGLRGVIPDFLSVVVANSFLTASYSVAYLAVRKFHHQLYRRELLLCPVAATFLVSLFFLIYTDNIFIRSLYITLVSAMQAGFVASILFQNTSPRTRRSQWFTGSVFALIALLWLSRFVELLISPVPLSRALDLAPLWAVILLLGIGVVILLNIGALLMIRERSEESLQQSEKQYRLIAENMADIIAVLDMNLRFTYISPSVRHIRGLTVSEAMEQTLDQVMTPESLKRAFCVFDEEMKLEASGTADPDRIRTIEVKEYMKDGSSIWMEVSMSFLRDENQKAVGILSVSRDISGRHQAEEALRKSEEYFRGITENSSDVIFIVDKRGFITYVSPSIKRILGYSPNELIGKNGIDLILPDDYSRAIEDFRRSLLTKEVAIPNSFRIRHRDGTERILEGVGVNLFDNPAIAGFVMNVRDITDRLQVDTEKKRLEKQLEQAQRMEALGTMAGGVAHDLNNVVGVIVGYSELLLYDLEPASPLRPILKNILEGSLKATAIVQDLLTLARRGVTNKKILNLNNIAIDCLNSPEAGKLFSYHPAVTIKTQLEPDQMNISGSAVHLGKTLYNLLANACEAMPNGGILTIKTSSQYLDQPIQGYAEVNKGDYAVLSVSDTGEGISEADLMRIFEPFYTKKFMGRSGTGLGLAVVWGTVKDHHGYITVQSQEGKGSIFSLYYPVTREAITSPEENIPISNYMGKGEFILIVDDAKEQRDLAEKVLRKLNCQVTSIPSGEEAVSYLKEHRVDLLVLDMIMDPGMDGLETYRKILEIHPHQKAIIVSGFSESERVQSAQALGAGVYVKKPYVLEKLGLAVRRELDRYF